MSAWFGALLQTGGVAISQVWLHKFLAEFQVYDTANAMTTCVYWASWLAVGQACQFPRYAIMRESSFVDTGVIGAGAGVGTGAGVLVQWSADVPHHPHWLQQSPPAQIVVVVLSRCPCRLGQPTPRRVGVPIPPPLRVVPKHIRPVCSTQQLRLASATNQRRQGRLVVVEKQHFARY